MAHGTCSVASCNDPVRCKRLCERHYSQKQRRERQDAKPTVYSECPQCKERFAQTRGRRTRQYCTPRCKSRAEAAANKAARQAARAVTHCLWCNRSIDHMRSDAKYCSDYCSNRADWRDNSDRITNTTRRYVQANHDKVLATNRRYREANRERIYSRQKAWQTINLEHHQNYQREYSRRWSTANRDKVLASVQRRRARKRNNGGGAAEITDRDLRRLLVRYDNRCAYCSCRLLDSWHTDHVVPLSRGGRDAIGNLVPACQRCNAEKADRLVMEWRLGIFYRRKKQPQ